MRSIKKALPVLLLLFLSCRENVTPYERIKQRTADIAGSGYVTLIYYTPLQCINCNVLLSSLLKDAGDLQNSFLVFGGIRDVELNDYKVSLQQSCGLDVKMINNKDTYNQGLLAAGIDTAHNDQPVVVILSPYSKKAFQFKLKDPQAAASISALKNKKQ